MKWKVWVVILQLCQHNLTKITTKKLSKHKHQQPVASVTLPGHHFPRGRTRCYILLCLPPPPSTHHSPWKIKISEEEKTKVDLLWTKWKAQREAKKEAEQQEQKVREERE